MADIKRANHNIKAMLRKVTNLAIAGVFLSNTFLSGLSFAQSFPGQKSTLRPWTVMEQPGRKREITAHMYRESRLIWIANSQRYLDLLARYNALALLLPSGRYLMTPETAANDLSLIRGCTHEDVEILMQQEEKLHSTRYERLKKQLLNNEEIMALYRKLSGYKDIATESDNIIFNDLVAKAFELLFVIDEYLVYPNTELTKEEREFARLMRPILEAKDARGRYKNFSQVFFDIDRRAKAIQALQEDKNERFYRVASTEDPDNERSDGREKDLEKIRGREYIPYQLQIAIPKNFRCQRMNINAIEANLAERNWFYRKAPLVIRNRAIARNKMLLDKLDKIQASDTYKRLVGNKKVVAINSTGSYSWHKMPGDIDLHFIVEGKHGFTMEHLSAQEIDDLDIRLIPSGKKMEDIVIQVIGTIDIEQTAAGINTDTDPVAKDLQRKLLTVYGNSAHLAGIDLFVGTDIPKENFIIYASNLVSGTYENEEKRRKRLFEAIAIEDMFQCQTSLINPDERSALQTGVDYFGTSLRSSPTTFGNAEEFLSHVLDRYPELNQLPAERLKHVKRVIEIYHAFVTGDFRKIFDALPDKARESVDYESEYLPLLKRLETLYNQLTNEEKEILETATILHDIGVPGGRAWTHNIRGAERARMILGQQAMPQEFIEKVARIIYHHGDFPDMGVDGLPRDLLELSESKWIMVLLISIFDGAGRTKGSVIMTDNLKSYLKLRETLTGHLERNDFYKYRFRHLLSPSTFVDVGEEGLNQLESIRDSFIPSQELESFRDNWNNRLRIYVFALFLDIAKGSDEDFVKLTKVISQISTVLMKENVELDNLIIDTDLDYMSMSQEQRDVFLARLRKILRAIPSNVDMAGIENELRNNHYGKAYGLPIRLEPRAKTLTIDLSLLEGDKLPDNSEYWMQAAPGFEQRKENDPQPLWFYDMLLRDAPKTAFILEVACGSGRALTEIIKKGYHNILGIDISEETLTMARRKGIPGTSLLQADVRKDAIPEEIHAILASDILLYLTPEELNLVMRKFYNSLRRDGKLAIRWAVGNDEIVNKGDRWVFLASEKFLRKLMEDSGFKVTHIEQKEEPIYGGNATCNYWYVLAEKIPSEISPSDVSSVKQAFDTLNTEARKVSQLNAEISRLRGTSQNIMEVTKFRFCVPVSVLKNSPDITHALNTTGLLRQKGKDSDKVEFELVVTGVSDEDVSLIEGLNRDDIRKALNLPERFTVSMITERQMQDSARRFNYDVTNPKHRVAIVKDFFSGTLAEGEYMAIATDALGVENDADNLQAEIEKEFKQELSQENISVRILVGPEHGKSMFSLSKIINNWLEALNQGNLSSIAKILPVPAPLTPELERAIRTAWAVLTAA